MTMATPIWKNPYPNYSGEELQINGLPLGPSQKRLRLVFSLTSQRSVTGPLLLLTRKNQSNMKIFPVKLPIHPNARLPGQEKL